MGLTGGAWEEKEPRHGLSVFGARDVGGWCWESTKPGLGNFVTLVKPFDRVSILIRVVLEALTDALKMQPLKLLDDHGSR